MFLYIFKIIIKLIMTSSRFDPRSTSVRPQKSWISPFYSSMNGSGLKTMIVGKNNEWRIIFRSELNAKGTNATNLY